MRIIKLKGQVGMGRTMLARRLPQLFGEPLRAPHHTASQTALLQEVTLAMGGVLYLDDADEFPKRTVETLCRHIAMVERYNPRVPVLVVSVADDRHKEIWREHGTEVVEVDYDYVGHTIGAFCALLDLLTNTNLT